MGAAARGWGYSWLPKLLLNPSVPVPLSRPSSARWIPLFRAWGYPPHRLLEALSGEALAGPFREGGRRFSAINRDGVPFQWSVATGSRACGLRFIADCGVPGTSISERIRHTRARLISLAEWLPLSSETLCSLDTALECVLPPSDLLDLSLMGLCVAAELTCHGSVHLKT